MPLMEISIFVLMRVLDRQAHAVTRKIDQLVNELYGLTNEEIRIVEEATK